MNRFHFNEKTEKIEDYIMASFDVIKTNKSQEQFMDDYKKARLKGNSIEDSIELAK